METTKWLSRILAFWLLGNVLFITVWDIVILALGYEQWTVSHYVYVTLSSRPWLYFLIGLGVGHLLAPLTIAAANNGAH